MIHESILLDLAAAMKYLREEEGFQHIVMLGNSGGGSLFSYYDAQARAAKGSRVASPPGGGPPDLNKYDFPTADGFIVLAAHPGQGMVLMNCLDAAVVDENDPFASDPDLDMYDERNGFKTPARGEPLHARVSREVSRRAAREMRTHRCDRASPHRRGQRGSRRDAHRKLQERAARDTAFHRASRDGAAHDVRLSHAGESELPRFVDRSIGARGRFDHLRRVRTWRTMWCSASDASSRPDAWLSTWSGLSSYARTAANLPKVTVPTLVVGANGDQDIFISDVKAEYEASGAKDKQLAFIEGADHFMRAGGTKANLGDPRPRLMKVLVEWTRERFAGMMPFASG